MIFLPSPVQTLLDQELRVLDQVPEQAFLPARRLAIYAAFGPTYASSSFQERIEQIRSGRAVLTQADHVRARLALLTAQRVAPLWFSAFDEAQLLTPAHVVEGVVHAFIQTIVEYGAQHIQDTLDELFPVRSISIEQLRVQLRQLPADGLDPRLRSVLEECIDLGEMFTAMPSHARMDITLNPDLAEVRSIYVMPFIAWPAHVLQLVQSVLEHRVAMDVVLDHSGDMLNALGNLFEEDVPAQAHDVGMAFVEALNQALGIGPFDYQEITSTTTEEWLAGRGAAAAPALRAYSGIFDGIYATEDYDLEKRRSFWRWWAQEAIPHAWRLEADQGEQPALETMPFEHTVRITAYRT